MNAFGGRGMYDASRFLPCEPRLGATTEEEEALGCSGDGCGICGVCVSCGSEWCCNVAAMGGDDEEKEAGVIPEWNVKVMVCEVGLSTRGGIPNNVACSTISFDASRTNHQRLTVVVVIVALIVVVARIIDERHIKVEKIRRGEKELKG